MITFKMKLSYGLGALGKDTACAIVYLFLMYYFTDILGLMPAFVGTLFLVARAWDAINDPMMGMIVDNTRTKYGKFRPWILIGTILNAIVVVFLFYKPAGLTGTALYTYISIMYILWGMTYTVMDIPFWAMIPSFSSDKKEIEKIAVVPRIFAALAWLLAGSFGLKFINYLGKTNPEKGFTLAALIVAIFFIFTSTLTFLYVKEQIVSNKKAPKVNLKDAFKLIVKNDQLVVFIVIVLTFNLMLQIVMGVSIYYFKYAVGNENLFAVFTGFSGITKMIALSSFPILSSKLGRKKVFLIACSMPVIGYSLLFLAGLFIPTSSLAVAICGIVVASGSGLSLGITTVMLVDIVDYGEFKFGSRNESVIFSAQTFLVKAASAVGGLMIGVGLSLIGYVPNVEQTSMTITGMRILMIGIPICLSIIEYIAYKKFYKLDNDQYIETINKELEVKRQLA